MASDEFQEFVESAVEEEAEALFGATVDCCFSSAYDDAYQDIEDEMQSYRDQLGVDIITASQARQCIRAALLQRQAQHQDDSEALYEDY